jgi:hypothetical protein
MLVKLMKCGPWIALIEVGQVKTLDHRHGRIAVLLP